MKTTPQFIGPSSDQRTNRWRVTCPACGHVFTPETTMMRIQNIVCPKAKCRKEMLARYNDEPPTVTLIEPAAK